MRYLIIALSLLLAACNLSTATQSDTEKLSTPTLAITATPLATVAVPAIQTTIPTQIPVQNNNVSNNPACTVRSDWQTYTVVSGDTLSQIAQRAGTDLNSLLTGNCITNADSLDVGQVLRVPSAVLPPPSNNTSSGTLPRVGEVAGMPDLGTCWASNGGLNPKVYDAIDGKAVATLSNRAVVIAATTTGWVQIDYIAGAQIRDGKGWMRIADVNLLGSCTERLGIQLDSFLPLFGNPAGIPDGLCVVVVHDYTITTPVYRDADGFQMGVMTGWGRWKSTFGNFYEVQYDDGGIGWVSASLTDRVNC